MSLGIGLVSPGLTVREVDLSRGSTLEDNQYVAGLVGAFPKGPINEIVTIRNESEFINTFGKPLTNANQADYYYIAESYLSYGGILKVVRCDDTGFNNANVAISTLGVTSTTSETLRIDNLEDYNVNHASSTNWAWAAKTPGSWANKLKICVIDDFADQIVSGITTLNLTVGMAVTCKLVGARVNIGIGTTSSWDTNTILNGTVTAIGSSSFSVKWNTYSATAGVSTFVEYKKGSNFELKTSDAESNNKLWVGNGNDVAFSTTSSQIVDWYDQQTLPINSKLYWKSFAPKPVGSSFAKSRGTYNDTVHVLVIDDTGLVTGVVGNVVEKHINLSKATNVTVSGKNIYYKPRIASDSKFIYAGYPDNGIPSKAGIATADGLWGSSVGIATTTTETENSKWFNVLGNKSINLIGGADYSGSGGYQADLTNIIESYTLISEKTEDLDFLLYGPSMTTIEQSQAKANKLIEIAEKRQDCIVTISPFRGGVVGVTNSDTQTNNIVNFFNAIDSSSYAVFDSGYKYVYDRFNNSYRYVPCNGDIAGLMVKASREAHSWYSPAGTARGSLRNVIKLAYNPNQIQRDSLYINRVNPIISNPGGGFILFGDKTAQSFESAFDRINVRRLFIEIEKTISNIANTLLFEFNDEITRSSFLSQVEPYLRDIEAKRGITDFLVVCDETNNTPEVIDRNELIAEIYVKPTRSINFIGLTFVATRTGVNFEEIVGRV